MGWGSLGGEMAAGWHFVSDLGDVLNNFGLAFR